MGDDPRVRTYLRQGLGDNGAVYITNGQTATGNFVAIVSAGSTSSGGITGTTITSAVSNIRDNADGQISNLFLPTGFCLPGGFQEVTVDSNATDVLICFNAPKDTQ